MPMRSMRFTPILLFSFLLIGTVTGLLFKVFFRPEHPLSVAACVMVGAISAFLGGLIGFWIGQRAGASWLGFLVATTAAIAALTGYEYVVVDRPHQMHVLQHSDYSPQLSFTPLGRALEQESEEHFDTEIVCES